MKSTKKDLDKKIYRKPELKRYGSIDQLTQSSSKGGADDGGMGMKDKTQ